VDGARKGNGKGKGSGWEKGGQYPVEDWRHCGREEVNYGGKGGCVITKQGTIDGEEKGVRSGRAACGKKRSERGGVELGIRRFRRMREVVRGLNRAISGEEWTQRGKKVLDRNARCGGVGETWGDLLRGCEKGKGGRERRGLADRGINWWGRRGPEAVGMGGKKEFATGVRLSCVTL